MGIPEKNKFNNAVAWAVLFLFLVLGASFLPPAVGEGGPRSEEDISEIIRKDHKEGPFSFHQEERPLQEWEFNNSPPTDVSIETNAVDGKIREGETLILTAHASDPDGDELHYEWYISSQDDSETDVIDSETDVKKYGAYQISIELKPGVYTITLEVIDYYSSHITTRNITIEVVEEVEDEPYSFCMVMVLSPCVLLALLVPLLLIVRRIRGNG